MSETKKPSLLTLKQAAELVAGLSEYRVKMLCVENKIKHFKFGKKYMIPEYELLKYFGDNA